MKTILPLISLFLLVNVLSAQVKKIKDIGSNYIISEYIVLDDHFVFVYNESLWVSDGTTDGTRSIAEYTIRPRFLNILQGKLYFISNSKIYEYQLSNPSPLVVFDAGQKIKDAAIIQNEIYFQTGITESKIQVFDTFTNTGTIIASNLPQIEYFYSTNDKIIFATNKKLWSVDSSNSVPLLLKDVSQISYEFINLEKGISHKNVMLFSLRSNNNATKETWRTDGTVAGTFKLMDGLFENFFIHDDKIILGNLLLFIVNESMTSTTELINLSDFGVRFHVSDFISYNNTILFTGYHHEFGVEKWVINSSLDEVNLLKDIWQGGGSGLKGEYYHGYKGVSNQYLYFSAVDKLLGSELWRTDGTTENTRLVKDIRTGRASANPRPTISIGNDFFFFSEDDGYALWKVDESVPLTEPNFPSSDYVWFETYGPPPSFSASFYSTFNKNLIIDKDDNIYLSGISHASPISFHNQNSVINPNLNFTIAPDRFITSLDASGQVRWSKYIGDGFFSSSLHLASDKNGDLIFCGYMGTQAVFDDTTLLPNFGNLFVGKFDQNGDLKWLKQNRIGHDGEVYQVVIDSENNIHVAGSFVNGVMEFGDMSLETYKEHALFVAKYSPNGDPLAIEELDYSQADEFFRARVVSLLFDENDNRYTTVSDAGYNVSSSCKYQNWFISIQKSDNQGNQLWRREMVSDDLTFAVDAALGKEGELFLVGKYRGAFAIGDDRMLSTSCENMQAFLMKIDAWGNVFDIQTIEDSNTSFFDIEFDKKGNYYISGLEILEEEEVEVYENRRKVFVKKYDKYNELLDEKLLGKYFNPNDFYSGSNPQIVLNQSSDVILQDRYSFFLDTISEAQFITSQNVYLMKFALPTESEYVNDGKLEANDILLTPNPTFDFISLSSADEDFIDVSMTVYNAAGQLIEIPFRDSFYGYRIFDVSKLPSGVYFISLELGEEMVTKKFIKVD